MQEKVAIKCIIRGLSQANGLFTWLALIRRESVALSQGPIGLVTVHVSLMSKEIRRTDEFIE